MKRKYKAKLIAPIMQRRNKACFYLNQHLRDSTPASIAHDFVKIENTQCLKCIHRMYKATGGICRDRGIDFKSKGEWV